MTLASLSIARKLSIGFACVLLTVAVMSAALLVSLNALGVASELISRSHHAIDDLNQAIAAVYEESRDAGHPREHRRNCLGQRRNRGGGQ